jgi:hypothetical protein
MEPRTAQNINKFYSILTYIGSALLFITSLAFIFGGSLLGFVMDTAMAQMMQFPDALAGKVVGAVAIIAGVILLLLAILYFKIAQALWRHEPWGRVAAIVIGVIELFSFPLGTLLGGFAVWFYGFSVEGKGLFMQTKPVVAKVAKSSRKKK